MGQRDAFRMLWVGVPSKKVITRMKTYRVAHGLEVLLWLALALAVVITQPALALLFLFLTPVWFFFADIVRAPLPRERESCRALPYPELLVFSPRPPPLR
jgi:hypothetical protein